MKKSEHINLYSTSNITIEGVAMKAERPFELSWLEMDSN